VAALGGAVISAFLVTPMDVVKTRIQTQKLGTSSKGVAQTFRTIVAKEGLPSLWRGLGLSTANAIPTVAVYLMAYDVVKEDLNRRPEFVSNAAAPLVSGTIARVIAVCLSAPLENARTMAQARSGAWQQLELAVKQQGVKALWRGFWPYLARDVPFSAIYWTLLEGMRTEAVSYIVDRRVQGAEVTEVSSTLPTWQVLFTYV